MRTLTVPDHIEPPRFNLFQKVRVKGRTAVVSGLYYSDFNTAVTEQSGYVGWNYVVNYVMDKPQDQLLRLINTLATEATNEFCEWELDEIGIEPVVEVQHGA